VAVHYLVLESFDPDLVDDPFHDAFGGVIDQFGDRHLIFLEPIDRSETDIQIIVRWTDEAKQIELSMHDNYLVGVRHLEVGGDHPLLEDLVGELRRVLPVLDPLPHLGASVERMQETPRLVFQVALAAPEQPDPRFVAFLERAVTHPDGDVRQMAAQAINLLGWPACLDSLQDAYAKERPGLTKSTMATALRAWARI
jgi:hypothetical protein